MQLLQKFMNYKHANMRHLITQVRTIYQDTNDYNVNNITVNRIIVYGEYNIHKRHLICFDCNIFINLIRVKYLVLYSCIVTHRRHLCCW